MSRSRAKHRVLTGIYSWVFICWLVWLVFVSTKISPVSSPRTRIHVLVSQAALATASKGPEEKSSFQSHRPQIMASGDRSITHTADSWTWGDCMPLSFSESIKAQRMPLSSQLKLVYLGNSAVISPIPQRADGRIGFTLLTWAISTGRQLYFGLRVCASMRAPAVAVG